MIAEREIWPSWSEVASAEMSRMFGMNRSEENGAVMADRIAPWQIAEVGRLIREKIGRCVVWLDPSHAGAWFVRVGPEDWEVCRDGGCI